ncbi:Dihydropteroate synthase [Paramagnetospirillum magnetotacticum MS-1]|uniref:dihydropteroate synthase n=1 Tax=Paramagnetospirillum magnetotacticum MS-1 TaxID=272627 RepID=A0A0C2U6B9_PARME|nr:dihydropteroate synthase [Paramagnetospirillum magnetotacticum]KIL96997.1 Dihydropteroate synthase [Paramagnetospirillum magnetotacticum MS-1]
MPEASVSSAFTRSPALPRGFDVSEGGLYLLPTGLVWGEQAAAAVISGNGWPLADGWAAFTALGVATRRQGGGADLAVAAFAEVVDWAEGEDPALARLVAETVHRIGSKRKPWGGLDLDRPRIMGIVNVTPDSFSDGGETFESGTAINHGLAMVEAGAAIIDVGGESTRPGADPVSPDEEMSRVLPVVRGLAEKGLCVSVDTRHASVMGAAVEAGARIINDVTALAGDPDSLKVAARSGAGLCLMHMQGDDPRTMQAAPNYTSAPLDVFDHLAERVRQCEAAGIARDRICLDPGIGFGKTPEHCAQILGALPLLHGLGAPLLLGVSRKSFVARLSKGEQASDRLPGTLAANLVGLDAGFQVLRVHDVAETVQAMAIWTGMRNGA